MVCLYRMGYNRNNVLFLKRFPFSGGLYNRPCEGLLRLRSGYENVCQEILVHVHDVHYRRNVAQLVQKIFSPENPSRSGNHIINDLFLNNFLTDCFTQVQNYNIIVLEMLLNVKLPRFVLSFFNPDCYVTD